MNLKHAALDVIKQSHKNITIVDTNLHTTQQTTLVLALNKFLMQYGTHIRHNMIQNSAYKNASGSVKEYGGKQ
ncbi:hypothetical protein GCM10011338_19780 [Alteromonas lipolytica]|uniref:Uncharacterized protein n=1 Tax=Alteromonas lipolytica TaxID=1856405 RepID=A0A1E8FD65_9ALTE|nr:hypothetical protein BFC17_20105 [Alteromonas lipolytica]GGF67620.1 hypothetical protein GCM10011338_19780 [Alteromonas lipolytica]